MEFNLTEIEIYSHFEMVGVGVVVVVGGGHLNRSQVRFSKVKTHYKACSRCDVSVRDIQTIFYCAQPPQPPSVCPTGGLVYGGVLDCPMSIP